LSALHDIFARASAWLGPALANHVWQATLFAALVLVATLLLQRGAPARDRRTRPRRRRRPTRPTRPTLGRGSA
jgi:hypothetical protein